MSDLKNLPDVDSSRSKIAYPTLRKLLSSKAWLQFNIYLARAIGINEAILLAFLIYKEEYWEEKGKLKSWEKNGETFEGFFFCLQEDIEEQTTLSPFQQSKALNNLKEKGFVKVIRKDVPPKNFFRLDDELYNKIVAMFKNQETWTLKIKKLGLHSNTESFTNESITNVEQSSTCESEKDSHKNPLSETSKTSTNRESPIIRTKRPVQDYIFPKTGEMAVVLSWNTLPKPAAEHTVFNTNVMKNVSKYLDSMRDGTLGGYKWDRSWLKRNDIPVKDFRQKVWSFREIRQVIEEALANMYKDEYVPENKRFLPKDLATALFNSHIGGSYFVQAYYHPPILAIPKDPYPKVTEKLVEERFIRWSQMKVNDWREYFRWVRDFERYLGKVNWNNHGAKQMFGYKGSNNLYHLIVQYVKWLKGEAPDLLAPDKVPESFHVGMIRPDFWMWKKFMEAVNRYWGQVFLCIPAEEK